MTGPEHYREAETLLASALAPGKKDARLIDAWLQGAQVHATLALAAASGIGPQEPSVCCALHADDTWREATQ